MKTIENNKIISKLFQEDIRNENLLKDFEKIFKVNIIDLLSDYDYDEIDEFPIEIENKGIMIGFMAETVKVPPQIEYIDFDIFRYPQNTKFLKKVVSLNTDFSKTENIKKEFSPCSNFRIFYNLHKPLEIDRIVFEYEDLRYELLINEENAIYRIRICFSENATNTNMRTHYPFN